MNTSVFLTLLRSIVRQRQECFSRPSFMTYHQYDCADAFECKDWINGGEAYANLVYLFSCPFCQDLLNSLLFFQQEGSHDTLLDAASTSRSSVSSRNSSLSLLQGCILARLDVLDSCQWALAVTAFRSIGCLVYTLLLELATRGSDGASLVLPSIVAMAPSSCPTWITHVYF